MVFFEAREAESKSELAAVITKNTLFSQLFDEVHAEVVDLRKTLGAKHAVI